MRRRIAAYFGLFVGAVLLASCGSDSRRDGPTSPFGPQSRQSNAIAGTCTSFSNLVSLVSTVFGAGSPNANSVLGKLNNLNGKLQQGDTAGAQAQAQNIVSFVQNKAQQGGLPGTQAQIQALINGVLCYAGLSGADTFLIFPSDQAQILKHSSGQAGLSLQPNTVDVPTLVTITFLPNNAPPLNTKLDQYPGFIALTQSSPLTKPAIVAVCPSSTIPTDVLARLRLGHQAVTGFEITPAADASFLDCSATVGQTGVSGLLHRLASLILPKPLYAKTLFSTGVGGLATEFSPFAPVDDELFLSSGAGGTRTEFQRLPGGDSLTRRLSPSDASNRSLTPGNRSNTVINGVCTQIDAIVGQPVETECRPTVTVKTFQGTLLQNVPLNWAVGVGGGVIAPEVTLSHTCGATFLSTALTTTDVNANASVCWTLGATRGTNTVVATPAPGGDAPLGVFFNGTFTFTATAKQITPTAGATGGTFPYDGLAHPGSGTCSNSLTPALSYSGDGSVPTNAGTYTLTVTCGAGNPLYVAVTAPATIQITPAVTNTSLVCPASAVFTGSPLTPCTASVAGPGLSQAVSPTYSANVNVGTATANASYPGGGNYQSSSGSGTFQVTAASTSTVVSCPPSVAFTGSAQTPCSATATGPGGLSVPVTPTYMSNVNAGTATASAAYAGGGNYLGSNGSGMFAITPAPTMASLSCPTSVKYTGSPVTPCTGSVAGPGLSQSLTPTYVNNIVGTATATVNYAGGGNYSPSTASKNFQIGYVQSGCFGSPVSNVIPPTKSYQKKGSTIPLKCTLLTGQGAGVANATGDVFVQDMGTDGLGPPVPAFSLANAFRVSSSGNYAYGLDTSPAGFVSGHFYFITATWSDGSTTNGWFYVK